MSHLPTFGKMKDHGERPWVGPLPGEEYEGVLAGTRDGFLRLRERIDEALEKEEADVSDLWDDYLQIRVVEKAPGGGEQKRTLKDWIQISAAVACAVFVLAAFVIGAIQIFRWMR